MLAGGHGDRAAALYGVVALQMGFATDGPAVLGEVNERSGLWTKLPPRLGIQGGFSVDIAIAELAELMRMEPLLAPQPERFDNCSSPATTPSECLDTRIVALSRQLATYMAALPVTAAGGQFTRTLCDLADTLLTLPHISIDEHVDVEEGVLNDLLILDKTREFLARNLDLLRISPSDVFDRAARLSEAALGPYFSNLWRLLRDTRDIFTLIDAAAGGRASVSQIECWSVLLSSHLPEDKLASLAAELGDRGMVNALRALLIRAARQKNTPALQDVIRAIRDASLDIDAFLVAEQAQHLLAVWRPTDVGEWRRLGEIRTLFRERESVEDAFARAAVLNPYDKILQQQRSDFLAGRAVTVENMVAGRRRLRQARLEAFRKLNPQ
jgi:hypothetical protein